MNERTYSRQKNKMATENKTQQQQQQNETKNLKGVILICLRSFLITFCFLLFVWFGFVFYSLFLFLLISIVHRNGIFQYVIENDRNGKGESGWTTSWSRNSVNFKTTWHSTVNETARDEFQTFFFLLLFYFLCFSFNHLPVPMKIFRYF